MTEIPVKPDRRIALFDRRIADAKAQAERVAELLVDRRSPGVRRAAKAESDYFDAREANIGER